MSAAEKLRALEVTIKSPAPERPYITQEKASVRVENALPQIIAVLEAAEKLRDSWHESDAECEQPYCLALDALDEALT